MDKQKPMMTEAELLDLYFLENRARLLEIASFLDRLDRARQDDEEARDYRLVAFKRALELLTAGNGGRTAAVQLSFSDHSSQPLASAAGLKATGAWRG